MYYQNFRFPIKYLLAAAFFLIAAKASLGQKNNTRAAWLITANVAYQNTLGEISNRFGNNYSIGAGFGYKTQGNWQYSFEVNYMFGRQVNNQNALIEELLGQQGFIFSQAGNHAQLNIFQRGVNALATAEKILPIFNTNGNSGVVAGFGGGFVTHWILYDNVGNDAPQILDEYSKGYDRLSGGPATTQSLGYQYFSNSEGINFKVSFDFIQAYTTNYRGFNYDTGMKDNSTNIDLFYSIRFNWYLPIYKKAKSNYYID